jgi:hypothetical protein
MELPDTDRRVRPDSGIPESMIGEIRMAAGDHD